MFVFIGNFVTIVAASTFVTENSLDYSKLYEVFTKIDMDQADPVLDLQANSDYLNLILADTKYSVDRSMDAPPSKDIGSSTNIIASS